jgi:hypothetical protein
MTFEELRTLIDDDDFLLSQDEFWDEFPDEMAELEEEIFN